MKKIVIKTATILSIVFMGLSAHAQVTLDINSDIDQKKIQKKIYPQAVEDFMRVFWTNLSKRTPETTQYLQQHLENGIVFGSVYLPIVFNTARLCGLEKIFYHAKKEAQNNGTWGK